MIKDILTSRCGFSQEDVPLILASSKQAVETSLDIQGFTREVNNKKDYNGRIKVLENLFRVALSDKSLHQDELEMLRKISGLFWISHKDFINTKLKIKKEIDKT